MNIIVPNFKFKLKGLSRGFFGNNIELYLPLDQVNLWLYAIEEANDNNSVKTLLQLMRDQIKDINY